MANFKIPKSKKVFTIDLENLGGNDEYSNTPSATRSPDMKNIINRLGMHQVRESIEQTYVVNPDGVETEDDDKYCLIKWIGKIEEYDDTGNPIPYYIKISEHLGTLNAANDSYIFISIWPSPDVRNIGFNMNDMPGYEKYRITYKKYTFTNYGETGNDRGLYEDVLYDGRTYVFTPIGILSFDCSTTFSNNLYTLNFNVKNVNDDPYVPTLVVASSPDGLNKEVYEPLNLLTDNRKAQFLGTANTTQYQLPEKVINNINSIKILQSTGQYAELAANLYTTNKLTGLVTFNTAPGESPVPGKDNVIIEYAKSPVEGHETNSFTLGTTSTYLTSTINVTKATNQTDPTKIDVQLDITVKKTSAINSTHELTASHLTVKAGANIVYEIEYSASDIAAIISNTGLVYTRNYIIPNDGSTETRNWTSTLTDNIKVTTTTTTTTGVPGSTGGTTYIGRQYYNFTTGLGLNIDARAVPHVGSGAGDSWWDIYASPRIYTFSGGYLAAGSRDVSAIIGGVNAGALSTGSLSGSGTWPSGGEVHRRVYYGQASGSISIQVSCNVNITFNGTYFGTMTSGNFWLGLPNITLPTQRTITNTSVSTTSESKTGSYSEGIKKSEDTTIDYTNNPESSARLACYYSTKATTVYGYENDRRVFVTNGTNSDTFSGRPVDPHYSSISYFPDTNYTALGEESNIMGYAQKAGYLFTVKEGADSLYVRKGTVIGDELQFPSVLVRRNVQILCRPIEIDGNIYIITRNGLEEVGFDYVYSYTYELVTYLRSYFISNYFRLGADYKYKQMEWYNESGLLHIYLDSYEFVFDLNSKSYVKESASSMGSQITTGLPYQFESYVCTVPKLNANLYAPKVTVYLPKDLERAEYGVVNIDVLPYGYNNTGVYKLNFDKNKIDILKSIDNGQEIEKRYAIKAHYYTPFLDFDTTTQLKTIKQIAINTAGHNGDEYYIGYVVPDGTQILIDKMITTAEDEQTFLRNGTTPFPKIISIKNKIRKFSNAKLFIKNRADYMDIDMLTPGQNADNFANMTFNRITLKYVDAGKYRGD